jgi:hypothetical protein
MNHSRLTSLLLVVVSLLLSPIVRAADEAAQGGEVLFNGKDLAGWKLRDPKLADQVWKVVSAVKLDAADPKKLASAGDGGTGDAVLFRQPVPHGSDLFTEKTFGDCEVHVEFVVPKGSNSGVYLMGQYEVQVLDSFGKADDKLGPGDCGGIYHTQKPDINASKAPGEWQSFDIIFRAPRFDAAGKKVQNAKFVKVMHNGKVIHENVDTPAPTGGELPGGEKARGPLLLQGDHGCVAFRNVRVKAVELK